MFSHVLQAALECKEAMHAQAKILAEKRKLEDYIDAKSQCDSALCAAAAGCCMHRCQRIISYKNMLYMNHTPSAMLAGSL